MKLNEKIFSKAALFSFIVLIALWGCGSDESSGPVPGTKEPDRQHPDKKITVGINTTIKSANIILAKELGLFKKQGLDVELVVEQTGADLIELLYQGKVDLVTIPEQLAAFAALHRNDFQILTVINRNQTQELIARKDHGIADIKDLKGKKIALTKKSGSPYWLNRMLVYNGLSIDDVQLLNAQPLDQIRMLDEGTVDALICWLPYTYKAREVLNKNAVWLKANLGQDMYWIVVGMKKWIHEDPVVSTKFLRAVQQATNFIETDPEQTKKILSVFLKLEKEKIDLEWPRHRFSLELPQNLILAMEQEVQWKIGQVKGEKNIPNFLNYIYWDALQKLNPDAVTIVH